MRWMGRYCDKKLFDARKNRSTNNRTETQTVNIPMVSCWGDRDKKPTWRKVVILNWLFCILLAMPFWILLWSSRPKQLCPEWICGRLRLCFKGWCLKSYIRFRGVTDNIHKAQDTQHTQICWLAISLLLVRIRLT